MNSPSKDKPPISPSNWSRGTSRAGASGRGGSLQSYRSRAFTREIPEPSSALGLLGSSPRVDRIFTNIDPPHDLNVQNGGYFLPLVGLGDPHSTHNGLEPMTIAENLLSAEDRGLGDFNANHNYGVAIAEALVSIPSILDSSSSQKLSFMPSKSIDVDPAMQSLLATSDAVKSDTEHSVIEVSAKDVVRRERPRSPRSRLPSGRPHIRHRYSISPASTKCKTSGVGVHDSKDFEYCKAICLSRSFKLPTNAIGCKCKGECVDLRICSCAKLNGGDFPYVQRDGGRLIEAKSVVFECGPSCGCSMSCVNRTSQHGLKYRLEVFRTAKKGWAVRSWDTIPSGAPVCEYTGILRRTDEIETDLENNYIFDIDCLQTMKGLDGRERRPGDMTLLKKFNDKKTDPEFCIDGGRVGSVSRFINHSCEPNLFVQCVLSTHHDIKMAKVMLFAADNIPPLQELSYDYGYALDSVVRPDGSIVQLPCFCGAAGCRKRLY